jgi:hypothetical protein
MNMPLAKRVEIAFWDLTINALSESPAMQRVVRSVYQAWRRFRPATLLVVIGLIAVASLFSGIGVCFLMLYLF